MEIVAFNADDKADGSGKAKITWISKTLLKTKHRMNPQNNGNLGTGTIGGWDKSEMKSYLLNTIAPLVPSNVRSGVVSVKKYSRIFNTSGSPVNDVETNETFWIPSRQEIFGAVINAETQGLFYSVAFSDNTSRSKSASYWWIRTAFSSDMFYNVKADGSDTIKSYAFNSNGIALGFCT